MALQSSGAISISDIKTELGSTSNSLRTLSSTVGFTTPDSMSEFYGYSSVVPNTEYFATSTYTGNGGTQVIDGKIGQAANFRASLSQYITYPRLESFFGQKTTFSTSLWFKVGSQSNDSWLFIDYSGNTNSEIKLESTGHITVGTYYGTLPAKNTTTSSTYNNDQWHHICVTLDTAANSRKTYIDNSLVLNDTLPSGTFSGQTKFFIGTGCLGAPSPIANTFLNGKIAQLRIFDRALSSSEVTTLYNENSSSSTKSTTDIFSDGSAVALYEFAGNVKDTGKVIDSGKSGEFNGTNSVVTIADNTTLRLTGSYTIAFWVYFNTVSGLQRMVNKDDAIDYSGGYSLFIQPGGQLGWSHNNGSNQNWDTGIYLGEQTWYHLAFRHDGTYRRLYINGVEYANRYTNVNANGENDKLFFGCYGDQTPVGQFLNGKLDDVRIYNTAISPSSILALATKDTSNYPTSNLVGYWKLDNNTNDSSGNGYNGAATSITYGDPAVANYDGLTFNNVGFSGSDFQPDLVWIKERDGVEHHRVQDSVRGAGYRIYPSTSSGEGYTSDSITSFNSNGFSVGSSLAVNQNTLSYVAWQWQAASSNATNTNGSRTSTVRANTQKGFSVIKFNSSGNADTVGHGLSQAPEMFITKTLTTGNWSVYHTAMGNTRGVYLNLPNAWVTSQYFWNNTSPTSSVITLYGAAGYDQMIYAWHSVPGYQKVGSYTGNGTTFNKISGVGFKPRFLLVKQYNASRNWNIYDDQRKVDRPIFQTNAQEAGDAERLYFYDDGFTWTNSAADFNVSGGLYLYLAIA